MSATTVPKVIHYDILESFDEVDGLHPENAPELPSRFH